MPPEELSKSPRGKLGPESRFFYGYSMQSARSGFRFSYRRFLGPCLRPLLLSTFCGRLPFSTLSLKSYIELSGWFRLEVWFSFFSFREASGVGILGIQFLAAWSALLEDSSLASNPAAGGSSKYSLLRVAQTTMAGRHTRTKTQESTEHRRKSTHIFWSNLSKLILEIQSRTVLRS